MNRPALIAALVMALLGGFLLFAYMRRFEDEASGGAPVKILVARKQIEPGTLVTEDLLATRIVPTAYVETRAIREGEKGRILGLRVATPVQAQQALMWTDLAIAADDRRDLSALVSPGMRAVAIRALNDDKSFALMRPGDRVDIIATMPVDNSTTSQKQSILLLQNVLVLAVGLDTSIDPGKTSEQRELLLNVSVNVPEAQLIQLAQEKGRLSVALRNPDDVKITEGVADLSSTLLTDAKGRKVVQDLRKTQPTGPQALKMGGTNP